MTVAVMITWHLKEENKEAYKGIFDCRAGAMKHAGYISSETFQDYSNPLEVTVISHWHSLEDWQKWREDPERQALQSNLEKYLHHPPNYEVFSTLKLREKIAG